MNVDTATTGTKIMKLVHVSVKVNNAVRLDKKNNKPRLLKISVDSQQSKAAVL